MCKKCVFISFFLITLLLTSVYAQEIGAPFIKNYEPLEFGGEPQVWAGITDSLGRFYNANYEYIFQYDGENWKKISVGKRKVVRSMDRNNNGKIFVGTVGDFGYLKTDSIGNTVYFSMLNYLDSADRDFDDVWNTVANDSMVFFVSRKSVFLFRYKNNYIDKNYKVWKAERMPYVFAYKVRSDFYFYHYAKGILKYDNDSLIAVSGTEQLKNYFIWQMFPYGQKKILLATSSGLFIYNPNAKTEDEFVTLSAFNEHEIAKTNDFIKQNQLYSATQINDSTYAFGTILKGIVIVNKKGKIIWNIDKNIGLPNNTIHHLYYDKSGILWASTAYGVAKIEFSLPVTFWYENNGLKGSIYSVHRSQNQVYASTNIGVFYLKDNNFYPVQGLTGKDALQCFDIHTLFDDENPAKSTVLVAANGTFYEITDFKAKRVAKFSTFGFIPSKDSSKLYFFEDNLLFSVQYSRGKFIFSDTLAVFDDYPTALSETQGNDLWAIAGGYPVHLVKKGDTFKQNSYQKELPEKIEFHDVILFNQKNYFIADSALYTYDSENDTFRKETKLFNGLITKIKDKFVMIEKINDDLTLLILERNKKNLISIIRKENEHYIIDTTVFKRLPQIDAVYPDNNYLWVLTVNKLYHLNISSRFNPPKAGDVLISRVKISADSIIAAYVNGNNTTYSLDFKNNNISFEYSLPYFFNEEANEYSYRLEGSKKFKNWSAWSKESKKEFGNLYEGEYTFYVKARNVFGFETEPAKYHFTILPPWYRSIWAYIIYIVAGVLFIWLLIKLNTRRLIKEKEHLEQIVKERTTEIEQQKEEIQAQAENLKETNNLLVERNEEINQQKEEIQAILDNLQDAYESISDMNEELARANKDIKNTNKKITDSILYAKRIQSAVLPSEKILEKYFSEHFLFFKPRDIVSGDFYWFRDMDKYLLLAVADGTGHGVPGAFISMMGATYLNEITTRTDLAKASDVLNILRDEVGEMLNTDDDMESRDGMDIAFCAINKETLEMQYSGAHHPLYIFRNGEFIIIEGDRMPIGISRRKKEFTNHQIQLQKGDTLYMFSDGFADQFGGENGRKYLIKRFKQLLQLIHRENMQHQKEVLENEFKTWKGNFNQVDDILIIGLRV